MNTRPSVPAPQPQVVRQIEGVPVTSMSAAFERDHPDMAAGMRQFVNDLVQGKQHINYQAREIQPIRRRSNSMESRRLEQRAIELEDQMIAQGVTLAVVVNLNPWPVKVNGVLHDETLPACPSATEWRQMGKSGKPFAYMVIERYKEETRDNGDGNWTCHPWVPMQLARDYIKECEVTEWGGIFFYPGRFAPNTPGLPQDMREMIDREWALAEKKLLVWARKMFRTAEAVHKRPNADKNLVGDRERWAALWLHDNGYLPKGLPGWVTEMSEESAKQKQCPACLNKVDITAILCGNGRCTYVFDPKHAYLTGLIDDTHPSLRRLKKEELLALDLGHVKSIAHLAGAAQAAPVVVPEDDTDISKIADGEMLAGEEELTDAELEALTRPGAEGAAKDAEAAAEQPEGQEQTKRGPGRPPKPKEPLKSAQQRKAEETLEKE